MSSSGYDAIVCGGGTAGPLAAAALVEAGRRVLLLEAGPDHGAHAAGRWPADLLDAARIPRSHDWGYVSSAELPGRTLPYERARVIGGCSAHNGCTVTWGVAADYDRWDLPGWSAEVVRPHLVEVSRRLRVRHFDDAELVPMHRAFMDAGAQTGLPRVDDLDTLEGVPGVGPQPSNSPEGIRWNAAFAYLDPIRGSGLLTIAADTLVDRVLVEQGRAVGVAASSPAGRIEPRAELVVLTAGAYGTPAVLLRSGIGPADELRTLGIAVTADNPGVGTNLHDHPAAEIVFAGTPALAAETTAFATGGGRIPDEQGFAKAASTHCADWPFDLHLFPAPAEDGRPEVFVSCVSPRSRGRVRLASADPAAAPLLDHGYLTDPAGHDRAVLLEGIALAREIAAAPAATRLFGPEAPATDGRTPSSQEFGHIPGGVVHYYHPVGSCALGIGCDERGRVHGVDGVVVADASLFPQTPRATTNVPTLAVAARVMELLLG